MINYHSEVTKEKAQNCYKENKDGLQGHTQNHYIDFSRQEENKNSKKGIGF